MIRHKLTLLLLLLSSSHVLGQSSHAVMYLDSSTSMNRKLETIDSTRCEASIKVAKTSVRNFFEKWRGKSINIKIFSKSEELRSLTGGFTNSKKHALNSLDVYQSESCQGSATALADAICDGVIELNENYSNIDDSNRYLIVASTDGEENGSRGICSGSDWQELLEDFVTSSDLPINVNMSILGKLDQTLVKDDSTVGEVSRNTLAFFSDLTAKTEGMTVFQNDYAEERAEFIPIFPNDVKFIESIEDSGAITPWKKTVSGKALSLSALLVDQKSFKQSLDRLDSKSERLDDLTKKIVDRPGFDPDLIKNTRLPGKVTDPKDLDSLIDFIKLNKPLKPTRPGIDIINPRPVSPIDDLRPIKPIGPFRPNPLLPGGPRPISPLPIRP